MRNSQTPLAISFKARFMRCVVKPAILLRKRFEGMVATSWNSGEVAIAGSSNRKGCLGFWFDWRIFVRVFWMFFVDRGLFWWCFGWCVFFIFWGIVLVIVLGMLDFGGFVLFFVNIFQIFWPPTSKPKEAMAGLEGEGAGLGGLFVVVFCNYYFWICLALKGITRLCFFVGGTLLCFLVLGLPLMCLSWGWKVCRDLFGVAVG